MFLNPRPSGLCRLITQYLFTRSQWRLWGLFAIVLAAYAFNIKLAVLYNDWNGRFFNALQAVNRDAIFRELFYFIGLAAVIIVLLVWAGYVKDRLALALRRDLTQIFFKRWLSPESAHYLLRESGREPDNPDQRVTEDVRQLVNLSVDLLVSFYDAMLTIGSFSVILWQLSGSAEVFGITIPGYMFWVCILYTIVATWITHLIGHKLKGLNINAQHMEANLRAALMEKRRHADAIAGAHAEAVEEAGLVERFRQLLSVLIALVKRKRDLNLFTVGVGQFTHLAPIFFALPSFFAGIIQLGGLMQIRGAFNDVARSLSWIIMSYDDLAALAAAYERLRRLEAGLSEADDQRRALEKRCQDNSCTGLTAALDLIGRKLKGLNINAQHMEANLRAALMEKRRHADAIAGAHAEAVEEAGLVERFRQLLSVLIALVKRKRDLNLFTVGVGQFTHLAPIFFALPSFFAGIIQLGGLMQIRGAFNDVARSLSWIIMSYDDLAALAAAYERLRRLEAGLSEADDQRRALEKRCQDNSCTGLTAALDLIVPNGKNISRVPVHLKLVPGSFTIVCGPSGIGKSTLLKVLSGFAGNYEGKLSERGSIFWMPQQPYLPKGELIAALTYPQSPETITEQAAQELLSAAHLDHLKEKLYDSGDWSALLSGGEQQRLSLLRALIVKPDILLLDEMTSGLDPANAHWMIALLKAKLPQTAMLLVTHQQSLWPLADQIINLQGPAHGQSVHSVSQM